MVRSRKAMLLGLGIAAAAITALGAIAGWAMSYSSFPPSGGGWRCYRDCIIAVWLFSTLPAAPYLIAKGTTYLWRRLYA